MDLQKRTLKIGGAVILLAIVLRLLGSGIPASITQTLTSPEAMSVLLYLETGRVVRPGQTAQTQPAETASTEPVATEQTTAQTQSVQPEPTLPHQAQAVFAADDAALVEVNSICGYDADVESLLGKTLSWDLTRDEPTVLIIHSHGTESYTQTEDYTESADYRTLDVGYNVVSIGDRLVQVLEKGGIHVLHDRTMHDSPSYTDSYVNSRQSVARYLEEYPSIRLVLDIHRDSVEDGSGSQVPFRTQYGGKSVAQLMLVVGTDASGLSHPDWPENMSLAVKLHAQLEKICPGICRPISFRSQRFNQDLSPGALIVEVGSAGNTRQEALLAAEQLGQAILDLASGTG